MTPGERGRNALKTVADRLDDLLGPDGYQIRNSIGDVSFEYDAQGHIIGAWVIVRVWVPEASAS